MNMSSPLTAEQFAEQKFDLPDGGRWSELVAGRIVQLQPPSEAHGDAVLNLSKAVAEHMAGPDAPESGYACYELGLVVTREPDTVRCPAMSWFSEQDRFAEADKTVTETRPSLVVEVASTNDRRREMDRRVREYLAWGVQRIWIADTIEKQVHVCRGSGDVRRLGETDVLTADAIISHFALRVRDLFADPDWWRG